MVFTRRPPNARTTGRTSSSCSASMRAFSSRDWRLVAAVKPFMSVSITATFSVRIRTPGHLTRRTGQGASHTRVRARPPGAARIAACLRASSPRRPLGRTGFAATALGAGDLADRAVPKDALRRHAAPRARRRAERRGHRAHVRGRLLRGDRRARRCAAAARASSSSTRSTTSTARSRRSSTASLARLGLPAVDLLVFHAVSDAASWRRLAARDGGMAELGEEIARGRARFRGISSHDPEVLDLALASCALRRGDVPGRPVLRPALRGRDPAARPRARRRHDLLQDVRRREAPRRHRGVRATRSRRARAGSSRPAARTPPRRGAPTPRGRGVPPLHA